MNEKSSLLIEKNRIKTNKELKILKIAHSNENKSYDIRVNKCLRFSLAQKNRFVLDLFPHFNISLC